MFLYFILGKLRMQLICFAELAQVLINVKTTFYLMEKACLKAAAL